MLAHDRKYSKKTPSEVAKSSRADAIRCELHKFYNSEIWTSDIMILMKEGHHVEPSGYVRLISTRPKRWYLKNKNCQQGNGDRFSMFEEYEN